MKKKRLPKYFLEKKGGEHIFTFVAIRRKYVY